MCVLLKELYSQISLTIATHKAFKIIYSNRTYTGKTFSQFLVLLSSYTYEGNLRTKLDKLTNDMNNFYLNILHMGTFTWQRATFCFSNSFYRHA